MFSNKKSTGIFLKLICVVLALTFVMTGMAVAEETPITVLIDGEKVEFDAQPKMVNDRVMVPLRAIFERLDAEVLWDPLFERVFINYNENDEIIMYINEEVVFKNGIQVHLDSPAFISESRTYVPLRFIAESLDQSVEWSDSTSTVYIVPKHKGMQYIPFGEFLTIPCPYSVNRNYKTLEYDNKSEVIKVTYSLNGESDSDFERYSLIMDAFGFKTVKQATEDDARIIYYGKGIVLTVILPDEEGTFFVELYEDATGDTLKEYLEGETENE